MRNLLISHKTQASSEQATQSSLGYLTGTMSAWSQHNANYKSKLIDSIVKHLPVELSETMISEGDETPAATVTVKPKTT